MNLFAKDGVSFVSIVMNASFQVVARFVSATSSVVVENESLYALVEAIVNFQKASIACSHNLVLYIEPAYNRFENEHLTVIGFGSGGNYMQLVFPTLDLLKQLSGESVGKFRDNIPFLSGYKI